MSTQSLVRLPKYKSSHHHNIHLSQAPIFQSKSHSIGWTYGSSPLAACTCLHTSSFGLQCLLLSDLATTIGHPIYSLVPMQHDHSTLWYDMHNTSRIILMKLRQVFQS